MQWHPLFAELLRPVVESHYHLQTNVPVGDVPREADIVLLRRKSPGPPTFRDLWKHLTNWNILEFKSPTVRPHTEDIDLLVELGLGIGRRLNQEGAKQKDSPVAPREISFWYLANRLGKQFLRESQERLGRLEGCGPGLWRSELLRRTVFLVSNADLPVNEESLPLHVVSKGPHATELSVARFVLERPALRKMYEQWVYMLHKQAWREVRAMAHAVDDEVPIDVKEVAEYIGVHRLVKELGLKRVIAEVGADQVVAELGLDRVIAEVGLDRVIAEVGLDRVIGSLTPAQRRELKRRLR